MSSILILDDRPADRELLAMLLDHAGHYIIEAATGDEALGLVRAERPDLVITDIVMPGMNGYEFVRRLRGERGTETVPVIFCTANYSLDEVRRLAAAVGVSRFLSKPSDFDTIVRVVADALRAPTTPPQPLAGEEFDREQLRLLNEKLVEKVGELEAADAERRKLVTQLINAHEEERRRIAEELHDGSIQAVVAIGMRLEMLVERTTDEHLSRELSSLHDDVTSTGQRLRQMLFGLQPVELDRSGLRVALEVFLEQTHADDGLEYEVVDRTTRQPTKAVRTLLYRAGREALANIRKHAGAARVEVLLDQDIRGFSLRVKDDGNGLDVAQALRVRAGHLGLPAIRERIEMAGGTLNLESTGGAGTALGVWLPDLGSADA
jgi:signal transduction histidine kinase